MSRGPQAAQGRGMRRKFSSHRSRSLLPERLRPHLECGARPNVVQRTALLMRPTTTRRRNRRVAGVRSRQACRCISAASEKGALSFSLCSKTLMEHGGVGTVYLRPTLFELYIPSFQHL
jgi:hypothetical protein